jgi:RNA polymerase sigma factor (sigma-70 family)
MTPSAETDRAGAEQARRTELAALLVRAQGGERAALDEIVDMLMPLVWNVARAGGADRELAADVVQNVWLVFLQRVGDIHNPAALASWLITVTRREVARLRTSTRRDLPVDQEMLTERPDPNVEVAAYVAEHENHRVLWQNLRQLSERCQELLRIVAFAERPNYRGIADKLRMPLGSIGPTRGRCLGELRRLLVNDPTWSLQ